MPVSMKADATPLTEEQREVIHKINNLGPNQRFVYFTNKPGSQIPSKMFEGIYRAYLAGKISLHQQIRNVDGARWFDYVAIGKQPPYVCVIEKPRD